MAIAFPVTKVIKSFAMKYLLSEILAIGAIVSFASTAYALQNQPPSPAAPVPVEKQLNREVVLTTCRQNRAETLPNPFVDVPPNHWAFKAVLTMHYCGVFRQATPNLPESVDSVKDAEGMKIK
jgi:hypothetical protein